MQPIAPATAVAIHLPVSAGAQPAETRLPTPAQLRAESMAALQPPRAAAGDAAQDRGTERALWRRVEPIPVAIVVLVLLGLGVVLVHSRSSSVRTLPALTETAAAIQAARTQAASDPTGAARALMDRAGNAASDDRVVLRDEAANILLAASAAAAQQGDPVRALAVLEQAAALADTQGGAKAQQAIPQARVTAARFLIDKGTIGNQAADLLRQAIAAAPASSAADTARELLARPVKVAGHLTVNGQPGSGLPVVLFTVAADAPANNPRAATTTPVATAHSDGSGAFDLGAVPPGTYLFGYTDSAGRLHHAAGQASLVTVAPAQPNTFDQSIAA